MRSAIIFILGPSGSGKSKLGQWIAEDLDFWHVEIDRWPDGDGINLADVRSEWNTFMQGNDASDLAHLLRNRVREAVKKGCVLTFPSMLVMPRKLIEEASRRGIRTVILYGTAAECLGAFLKREETLRRGIDQEHWILNNKNSYIEFSRSEFAPYRVVSFSSGSHRPRTELLAEIRTVLAI